MHVLRSVPWVSCLLLSVAGAARVGADDLQEVEERMARVQAEARRLRAEEQALADQRRRAEAALGERVRALYRLTRAGMLPLAGGFEALLAHAGRVGHLRNMVERRQRMLAVIEERQRGVRLERARRARLLAELRDRAEALRQREAALQRDALRAVFRSSRFAPSFAPAGAVGAGFAAQRGRLASPLTGTFRVSRSASESGPSLDLQGHAGASVRAVADGRVAFADDLPGRGLVVVLDHGGGWFTVYGGLGDIGVQLDDYVGRGAELGVLREDGVLRLEVRRGQRAVDPTPWLGF